MGCSMSTKANATIEDLYHVPGNGKAEIVNGELVLMPPTRDLPNRAGGAVYVSLRLYELNIPSGRAYSDNAGFKVNLPNRESYRRGQTAEAEPAVPGWRIPVDSLFE